MRHISNSRKRLQLLACLLPACAGAQDESTSTPAFGTDAGVYPHGDNAHEFELMVQAGMPASFALQSATKNAARLLRMDKDIGSVEAGQHAETVAVPGNPREDSPGMKRVDFVRKGGGVYTGGAQPASP